MSETCNKEIPVYASSGNIFADLGRPDAEEAFARMLQAKQNEGIKHENNKNSLIFLPCAKIQ